MRVRGSFLICVALMQLGCWRARPTSSIVQRQTDARRCLFNRIDEGGLHPPMESLDPAVVQRVLALPAAQQLLARVALGAALPLPESDTQEAWDALALKIANIAPRLQMEVTAGRMVTDCQGDQVQDLRGEMQRAQGDHQLAWSAGSIAVAGLGALATGIIDLVKDNSTGTPIVSITAGVGAAVLAVGALRVPAAPMQLKHERNTLRAIWIGRDEEHIFPDFVWRTLDIPVSKDMPSPRETLLTEWKQILDEHAGKGDDRQRWEALLFGPGGKYSLDQLQVREVFFAQLESEIQMMHETIYLADEYAEHLNDVHQ